MPLKSLRNGPSSAMRFPWFGFEKDRFIGVSLRSRDFQKLIVHDPGCRVKTSIFMLPILPSR